MAGNGYASSSYVCWGHTEKADLIWLAFLCLLQEVGIKKQLGIWSSIDRLPTFLKSVTCQTKVQHRMAIDRKELPKIWLNKNFYTHAANSFTLFGKVMVNRSRTYGFPQSTRHCGLKGTRRLVFLKRAPSVAPATANAQQDEQVVPWTETKVGCDNH